MRVWRRAVGLLAIAGLLAACDIGSIRRPAPVRTPSPPAASASTRAGAAEVRHARVSVPVGFTMQTLTFVDSMQGYALYTRCRYGSAPTPRCEASLFTTVDGGRSWVVRRHPQPFATNQQMVVSDTGTIMLLAEPYGWYVSRDGGLSFRRASSTVQPPAEYYLLSGRFQVWRSADGQNRLIDYADGHRRELPVQPPLAQGPTDAKYDESGRLWVAGLEGGRPVVVLSRDDGRTWQRQEVPGQVGSLVVAWLEISAGAGDVWLLGQSAPSAFPWLWRFDGARWVEQPAIGHPAEMRSIAALGNSVLAVAEPYGCGLVGPQGYRDCDWPLADSYLRVLSDGTLMSGRVVKGEVFLGFGHGTDRRWVQITFDTG